MENEQEEQGAFNSTGIINKKAQGIEVEHHLDDREMNGIESIIGIFKVFLEPG
jgi:hypothetical protein